MPPRPKNIDRLLTEYSSDGVFVGPVILPMVGHRVREMLENALGKWMGCRLLVC